MRSRRAWRCASALALTLFAAAALVAPLSANAATITNGGFEDGVFGGWTLQQSGSGAWFEYSNTTSPLSGQTISAPPQGTFAAITDENNPGTHILYQDVALEPASIQKLSLIAYYDTNAFNFITPSPDTLDSTGMGTNQQYRIEVMKPSAPVASVNPADILLTVFRTKAGDPATMAPTTMTADLTPFAGQTVRLRFAEVDNAGVFNAGVDAVSLASTSIPIPNAFTFGKLKRNKHKGTATLAVHVPGPGILSLTGDGVKHQRSARATASQVASAAGTVYLAIKPKTKIKKKLKKRGKAKVKVTVAYTPTGGFTAKQSERVKLVKKLG
jgi:hypothetical protein